MDEMLNRDNNNNDYKEITRKTEAFLQMKKLDIAKLKRPSQHNWVRSSSFERIDVNGFTKLEFTKMIVRVCRLNIP